MWLTATMTITFTPEKAPKVSMARTKMLAKSEHSVLEVSQVIGLLVASLPAVQYWQLHYRHLEIDKKIAFKFAKGNYFDTMSSSPAATSDLAWWVDNVLQSKNLISHGRIDIESHVMLPKKAGEQFAVRLLPNAFGLLENSHNTLMSWNSLQLSLPWKSLNHNYQGSMWKS